MLIMVTTGIAMIYTHIYIYIKYHIYIISHIYIYNIMYKAKTITMVDYDASYDEYHGQLWLYGIYHGYIMIHIVEIWWVTMVNYGSYNGYVVTMINYGLILILWLILWWISTLTIINIVGMYYG